MLKYKQIFFIPVIIIFEILLSNILQSPDIIYIFSGVNLKENAIEYIIFAALFATYSFLIFTQAEQYLLQYGVLLMIRYGTRKKVYKKIILHMAGQILALQTMVVLFYVGITWIRFQSIKIDVYEFLIQLLLSTITILIMMVIQTVVELLVSPVIALFTVLASYISMTAAGSVIYISYMDDNEKLGVLLNSVLITNYSMKIRVDYFIEQLQFSYPVMLFVLVLIFIAVVWIGREKFAHKELL